MSIKSLLSKKNLLVIINPLIYIINIIFMVILVFFINKNVYQTIIIQGEELKNQINEAPKNINTEKFNEIISKINYKKNKQPLINIGEIF